MKRLNSAVVYFLFVIAIMALICARAYGQTCSVANPCVPIGFPKSTVGDTITLYKCVGTAAVCSPAALAAQLAGGNSPFNTVASFPLKSLTATAYQDPEPYGTLVYYAATDTPSGGAAGPVSAIVAFQMPQATQITPPTLTAGPAMATTGPAGPQ
jgi:hypothetical protein